MYQDTTEVCITRQGEYVGDWIVKVRTKTGRTHDHISPALEHGQVPRFLIFDDVDASVQIGDTVTAGDPVFLGNCLAKVFGVRPYQTSLQVDLQLITGLTFKLFSPNKMGASIDATGNVVDVKYSSATPSTAFAYLEPLSESDKLIAAGRSDMRMAYAYTVAPLILGQVLSLSGEYWFAKHHSDVWPVIGVCRTTMQRLLAPPSGVT